MIPDKIKNLRDFKNFRPTYLYLKQHKDTGLLYFGKTCGDVERYLGSGKYWKNHLKAHGDQVETLWFCLFTNREDLYQFAVQYSIQEDIVKNESYANQIIEEGFNGGTLGHKQNRKPYKHSESAKANRRNKVRAKCKATGKLLGLVDKQDIRFLAGEIESVHGNCYSKETISKIRESRKDYKPTEETKRKTSQALKGRIRPKEESAKASATLKGRAPAKNSITGEYVGFISIEDPRWKSGEIISNFKGRQKKSSP